MNIRSLTREQLAGQRLMVGFDGTALDADLKYLIDTVKVGGLILFGKNVISPDQVRALCFGAQDYAKACGQPPLIIAIDQEGGQVARLKKPFTEFEGQPAMNRIEDAVRFARISARELAGVGINMNFSPVLDVAPREIQSIMAGRSFGPDPDWVAQMGVTVIHHLQQNGMMAVAKHFPGIGRTTLDSHLDLPTLDAPVSALMDVDLIPFQQAVEANVAGMMLSHIMYPRLDPVWPASLSSAIARDLLREKLGYTGVVMTDDLDMGAIDKHFGFTEAVSRAIDARIDWILICHRSDKIEAGFEEIMSKMSVSQRCREHAVVSVDRIMTLKKHYLSTAE